MVKNTFSTGWKSSTQPRKQRKYVYNAPLHTKQTMVHVHLSSELKKKYGTRRVQVKKGDKVKILRGQYKKKEGKVERVNLKQGKLFITGVEFIKKDGTKIPVAFTPSNIMIIAVDLGDKKRKQKLENNATAQSSPKTTPKNVPQAQDVPKQSAPTQDTKSQGETQ
ncbi:50S ribosomal protein L24 [Candidatus Woesearchaeota archaeon]|jgi:large subunit ribosomal protein L24|nr:50S ribosomal protein L24 [Candidatus Woesearchaeota archaeon]MBT5397330.1 50S ribosomal protein L24 [Candidatus Woesearchaeota archaeon]MBT5924446.1 50S ribosomal protein L24 [Candidatus Woesearchaeota archaeon]MBT6367825.1 50S ribosomal protein L24 [Candidatus Woesearchaeota archaeon]MBT7762730.1 50S ribosomal protein L24 [Candidatus Woesearchaeota archaeon]